mmetsp:Transcript_31532/g.57294  ORF Transcript_31532/g.57294 Transcript_31532/m.57294 type:complete len:319 (+) Transcript_31532:248-1204(+)
MAAAVSSCALSKGGAGIGGDDSGAEAPPCLKFAGLEWPTEPEPFCAGLLCAGLVSPAALAVAEASALPGPSSLVAAGAKFLRDISALGLLVTITALGVCASVSIKTFVGAALHTVVSELERETSWSAGRSPLRCLLKPCAAKRSSSSRIRASCSAACFVADAAACSSSEMRAACDFTKALKFSSRPSRMIDDLSSVLVSAWPFSRAISASRCSTSNCKASTSCHNTSFTFPLSWWSPSGSRKPSRFKDLNGAWPLEAFLPRKAADTAAAPAALAAAATASVAALLTRDSDWDGLSSPRTAILDWSSLITMLFTGENGK